MSPGTTGVVRCREQISMLAQNSNRRYGFSWRHFTCVKNEEHSGRHRTKDDLSSLHTGIQGPIFWQTLLTSPHGELISFHEDSEILFIVIFGDGYRACPYSVGLDQNGEPHPHQAGTVEWIKEHGVCATCDKLVAEYVPAHLAVAAGGC